MQNISSLSSGWMTGTSTDLPFYCPSHNDNSMLGPGNGPFNEHQVRFSPEVYNLKILYRDLFVAPMAGHLFSFPNSTRKGTVADGPAVAKVFVGTVRPREATEGPPFDHACKSVPFRGSRYIDTIAGLEQVRSLNLLPDLKLRHIVQTKFLQNFEGALAGLGHMALLRLVDSLILLAAEAHLDGAVAVFCIFLFLHDNAWAGLDNRDRNDISVRVIELRHANFFANKTCHKTFQQRISIICSITGV